MTSDQKLNLKNPSFNERMDKLVEYIGIDLIIPFIPAKKGEIRTALENNDTALNTISLFHDGIEHQDLVSMEVRLIIYIVVYQDYYFHEV